MSNERWCEWHVLIVSGTETDDREVDVLHPGCPFTFNHGLGGVDSFDYACLIEYELANVGFDTLLEGCGAGWYRARMRMVTVSGFDFSSEIDAECEVETLGLQSAASVPLPPQEKFYGGDG